jgi:beta-lactam-binding protein with PASTA domain
MATRAIWRGRARRVLPYAAVGGAGFLLAYLAVYFFIFPSRLVPDDRPVPDVIGMPVDAATARLSEAGFTPQVGEQRVNMSVPPFTVVRQNPAATTVKPRATTVVIDIAVGQ